MAFIILEWAIRMGSLYNLVKDFPCLATQVLFLACDFFLHLFDPPVMFREMTCCCCHIL